MLEIICGGLVGACITDLVWYRKYIKLQRLHESLLADSLNLLNEYWIFRRKFEEYRARFDPINTSRDGNVITIERGKK